jgi:hypothetical protein
VFASFGVLAAALHVSGGNVKAVAAANPALMTRSFRPAGDKTLARGRGKAGSAGLFRGHGKRGLAFYVQGRWERVEFYFDFVT